MHFSHTPETLLGRNDSKNPNTTCQGITSSGRPCRRALASSKATLIGRSRASNSALGGVVALVHEDGELQEADFYCWQHKDQAAQRMDDEAANWKASAGRRPNRRSTELFPLKEKTSIDTMVQKLGINAAEDDSRRQVRTSTKNPKAPKRTNTIDFAATQSRPSVALYAEKYNLGGTGQPTQRRAQNDGFWASLCCMAGDDDDDYVEIVRHKKRVDRTQTQQTWPETAQSNNYGPSPTSIPARQPFSPSRASLPNIQRPTASHSETGNLLSLIPAHLTPNTASALLAELTKPIGSHDEKGYIYIFWLTPQSKDAPAESTARSLLSPLEADRRPSHRRRISDVMTEYSFDGDDTSASEGATDSKKRTILLKIGRANNITRRMNEWQRQCGYALNLIRWYPYVSSSPQPSPRSERQVLYPDLSRPSASRRQSSGAEVHKVPCVKRVERLIHLELSERQAKRQCDACGKEHREWFQVEASQAGVKAVDEVVRRWVAWGETQTES